MKEQMLCSFEAFFFKLTAWVEGIAIEEILYCKVWLDLTKVCVSVLYILDSLVF